MNETLFQNRIPSAEKLLAFGFTQEEGAYAYGTSVCGGEFFLRVKIASDGGVRTELTDALTKEPYTLHLLPEANGAFVGAVREEYRRTLALIAEQCFERNAFTGASARDAIDYVRQTYGDEPEYLWESTPENAVWRRKDNRKWYGALLTVKGSRLGLEDDGAVEILDLRAAAEKLPSMIDGKRLFAGYHMNKKHWVTVLLDGSVSSEELYRLIDESYLLAAKK